MRDQTQLHPRLQHLANELVNACKEQGLKICITECFRTKKEQDALYAQGRTKPGMIVTNAKGKTYSSMHQWGVAFDICRDDGKGAYYDEDGFFNKVGEIGTRLGLEWGGSWTSIKDKPHFQLPNWGSTPQKLKETYITPDKFIKTWSAKATYKTGTRIRKEKSVESEVKIIIPKGKKCSVLDVDEEWSKVKYKDVVGYAKNIYLKY